MSEKSRYAIVPNRFWGCDRPRVAHPLLGLLIAAVAQQCQKLRQQCLGSLFDLVENGF